MSTYLLKGFCFTLVGMCLFTSCKKDEIGVPNPIAEEPIFYFDALLDNSEIGMKAGVDDNYMHTDWSKDQDDINTFEGTLGKESCTDMCEGSFRFSLRDYDFNSANTDKNLALGSLGYNFKNEMAIHSESDVYRVQFDSNREVDDPNFVWSFDDDTEAFGIDAPIHIYDQPMDFVVPRFGHTIDDNFLCDAASKARHLPIEVPGTPSGDDVNAFFVAEDLGNNKVRLNLNIDESTMEASNLFLWTVSKDYCSDQPFVEGIPTVDRFIEIDVDEMLNVGVTILFGDGFLSSAIVDMDATVYFDASGELKLFSVDFDYQIEKISAGSKYAFQTFVLEYIDANGKYYSSSLGEQNDDAVFNILKAEGYENNAQGQKTRKLEVEAHCKLFAEDGSFISLTEGKGVIALAHP